MIAQVVPITRLRRATGWWSYRVPANLSCVPGSLVVVPFRNHPVLGIVWAIEKEDRKATASIQSVLTQQPLVRHPHRLFVEWLSEAGLCSLSTALYVWLPKGLTRWPLSKAAQQLLEENQDLTLSSQALAEQRQQLVAVPEHRPDIAQSLREKAGKKFRALFGGEDQEELADWLAVSSGKTQVGFGRERAIFAPWLNLHSITVAEPEDISYFHEQIPYLNLVTATRKLAEIFQASLHFRTYVPEKAARLLWGTEVQVKPFVAQVHITELQGQKPLNETLLTALQECLKQGKEAILLLNSLDRVIRDEEGLKLLPGVQSLTKQLAASLGLSALPSTFHLGTRAILNRRYANVGLTAVLALDPLIQQTIFSEQVHGWSDLGQLLSYDAPCFMQAHQYAHPLVQALRNGLFEEYCFQQTETQQRLGLPPFAECFVAALKQGTEATSAATELQAELQPLLASPWQVSYPFPALRRKEEMVNVLLHAPLGTRLPVAARKKLAALPRPWKIQANPWYTM